MRTKLRNTMKFTTKYILDLILSTISLQYPKPIQIFKFIEKEYFKLKETALGDKVLVS